VHPGRTRIIADAASMRSWGVPRALPEGIYEHLVTAELEHAIGGSSPLIAALAAVADAEVHVLLGRHVGDEIARALDGLAREGRGEAASALVGQILDDLASRVGAGGELRDQRPAPPLRRLLAMHRGTEPERPATPLTQSTLLTRNRHEPALGHEIAREISSADRIDVLIAFITIGGVRTIIDALERFARRGAGLRMRVLTTTFNGITEMRALDQLARLPGVEVRISFDVRRTRLHAKAWMFHRTSGLTTAYVGSANLTSTALGAGQEWMVKVCAADLPHVVDKFAGTFDTLWADPEFERYTLDGVDLRERVRAALGRSSDGGRSSGPLFALRPLPFQDEILDRLAAERAVHGRRRNLVVAATGTGKTVIAAFDYARAYAAAGVAPRLLFLAHRRELLEQAMATFRAVMQDHAFGELLVDGLRPVRDDHVFASIQSAVASDLLGRLGPEHFRHVIVDECHHVPARSYQALVPHLRPDLLVGLTATPERSDGRSLLPDFDGHIAAELRLWHALDDQLLVPFEYYGISDGVDLRAVRWSRAGYDAAALGDIYTGHDARADLVAAQLRRRVGDVRSMRALGFCVSVGHARFMAARFTAAGIPAVAVDGTSDDAVRASAPRQLRDGAVNVVFTCDLYNEGVDLPFVDTLLLLRPTMSATLFLQQLGRGLRHHPGKTSCLVLDFIGQHHSDFRFDATIAAVTGVPRATLRRAVEDGFPYLPSGCSFQLDSVARDTVLASLRATLGGARRLVAELRELSTGAPSPLTLAGFLDATGRDVEEVYRAGGWSTLRGLAGLAEVSEPDREVSERLRLLLHVDEPARLRSYRDAIAAAASGEPSLDATDRVRLHMLDFQLHHRGVLRAAEDTARWLAGRAVIRDELEQLREVLEDRVSLAIETYPVAGWPLALHRHYERREIIAAVGRAVPGKKGSIPQGGVFAVDERREVLFVTLDKSGKGFSPTTRYRDYAISPDRFHWETQAAASVRTSGRRYVESPGNGWSFYLFVRTDPEAAFAFAGPVRYESHHGDRPIAITWRLAQPLPAALFERYRTLLPG
jgi:superfamily II DNA or RNA helicase/HKD family nuclease